MLIRERSRAFANQALERAAFLVLLIAMLLLLDLIILVDEIGLTCIVLVKAQLQRVFLRESSLKTFVPLVMVNHLSHPQKPLDAFFTICVDERAHFLAHCEGLAGMKEYYFDLQSCARIASSFFSSVLTL